MRRCMGSEKGSEKREACDLFPEGRRQLKDANGLQALTECLRRSRETSWLVKRASVLTTLEEGSAARNVAREKLAELGDSRMRRDTKHGRLFCAINVDVGDMP